MREIFVAFNGSLQIGSATCRLFSTIDITFYGTKDDSNTKLMNPNLGMHSYMYTIPHHTRRLEYIIVLLITFGYTG